MRAVIGMARFADLAQGRATSQQLDAVAKASEALSPLDPINVQFTSGTTGLPKGATLTHRGIINNGYIAGHILGLTSRDKLCLPVPMFHCFGPCLNR